MIHFYTANPYVWTSFIAGLTIYGVFALLQKKETVIQNGRIPVIGAAVMSTALGASAFLRETSVWYHIAFFAVILILGLVITACGYRTPKYVVKLGNISYSYYLLHYYTVSIAARYLGIDCFSLRNVLLALLICAATWGISWGSWYLIENKLTRYLQKAILHM